MFSGSKEELAEMINKLEETIKRIENTKFKIDYEKYPISTMDLIIPIQKREPYFKPFDPIVPHNLLNNHAELIEYLNKKIIECGKLIEEKNIINKD